MSILTLPQGRIPIGWSTIDGKKIPVVLDLEWARYFAILDSRAGSVMGPSTTELAEAAPDDAGIEEIKADVYSLRNSLMVSPPYEPTPQEQFLETRINELTAQVHQLQTMLQDVNQGYQI